MTSKEALRLKNNIYTSLSDSRIHDSLPMISTLVDDSGAGQLMDELNNIRIEYKYLLEYFSKGVLDPDREHIYNNLVYRLFAVTDKATSEVLTREDFGLYYGIKRTKKKALQPLDSLLSKFVKAVDDIKLYNEVPDEHRDNSKYKSMLLAKEQSETELFKAVWTSFPQSNENIATLNELYSSEEYPEYLKSFILSAILLSSLQYFSEPLVILLLSVYNSENADLSIKALCAFVIIAFMHGERISHSAKITEMLNVLQDKPQFTSDVKCVLYLLIRSKNTERISKKVQDELLPKLMKIYPKVFKKIRADKSMIDMSDLESNPEWKNLLDDGLTKKIEELNKLQLDGGDVFIGTFSHLKSFPFFSEASNWFLPFQKEHSTLYDAFGNKESKLIQVILDSPFFCDSDKYSFAASFTSVPESQRNAMVSQFDEQNNAIRELKHSELATTQKTSRETIANLYIQNLYRFFKLFPRKNEFADPFNLEYSIKKANTLFNRIDFQETISVIGEFYLKNEYFKEAIECFNVLHEKYSEISGPVVLQKIGFCYQNLEQFDKAIEFYNKYELYANNDLWNLKHLAACYRAKKQPELALNYYQAAEQLVPDNMNLCMNIGHCLLELDRYEDALKYYFKVYYLEPASPRVWRPIAWCLFLQGNNAQSRTYYDKIINEKPVSVDYMNYGHLLFTEGAITEAITYYRRAVELEGNSLDKFIENYQSDIPVLIKSGIKRSDISIILDALSSEMGS